MGFAKLSVNRFNSAFANKVYIQILDKANPRHMHENIKFPFTKFIFFPAE